MNLYNGCNILVVTVPCLVDLLRKQSQLIKTNRFECIAFENIDCIMEKHLDACKYIIKELCSSKSFSNQKRQIIVTSRTWQPFLNQFLNETITVESVLLIGNHLEAAFYRNVSFELKFTDNKLQDLAGN